VIHHERDVREEQQYTYVAPTSNDRVIAVHGLSHMPLGLFRSQQYTRLHACFMDNVMLQLTGDR